MDKSDLIKEQLNKLGIKPAASNDSRYRSLVNDLLKTEKSEDFVAKINKTYSKNFKPYSLDRHTIYNLNLKH